MIEMFCKKNIIPIIIIDEFDMACQTDNAEAASLIELAKNLRYKSSFVLVGSH